MQLRLQALANLLLLGQLWVHCLVPYWPLLPEVDTTALPPQE